MDAAFKSFTDQIPEEIQKNVPTFMGKNMVLFKPQCYVADLEVYTTDYHFTIPGSPPPPIKIGNQVYQFRKGRLLFFYPDTTIMSAQHPPAAQYLAWIIKKNFFEEITREVTGQTKVIGAKTDNSFSPKLLAILKTFEDEFIYPHNKCALMMQSVTIQLAVQLLRELDKELVDEHKKGTNYNYVNKAIDYIQAYYNTNINIDDICKAINLSPYHFIRIFKAQIGLTPHEYLMQVRLEKAEEMLQRGGCSVEEVAHMCGFINPGHFSTLFKKVIGIPPSRYKRNYYI